MASSVSAVKEIINSDPGATFDNFSADSPRVWTIPILDDMDVAGREEVVVVGFAAFFIEDIEKKSRTSRSYRSVCSIHYQRRA